MRSFILLLFTTWSLCAIADEPMGKVIFTNFCFTCHGINGEGNAQLKAPSIAGMPTWYVQAQIENFRQGRRGFAPNDAEGQLMSASAKAMNQEQIKAAAEFVTTLKRVTPKATIVAETKVGQELYAERCMECHRYNGEGEMTFGSPPLMGLPDWYIMAQIKKFKLGHRGVAKNDANGLKMAFSSGFIESESVLHSVVAYIMSLQAPAQSEAKDPFDQGLLSRQK